MIAAQRRVGLYLAVVQFFFALTWTVYVIFLPQLAAQAGIAKAAVIWILMLDQLIFVFSDYAMGVAADRSARIVGRVGNMVLLVTLLSCAAFVALPLVAPQHSAGAFIVLVALWAASSSALRAPPLALVGRHASLPSQPWLVALSLFGIGLANALAPYLGVTLRGVDPRLPFIVSSVALAAVTIGIVAAERALARSSASPAVPGPAAPAVSASTARLATAPALAIFIVAAVLVSVAFQGHVFLNTSPLYLKFAQPADLQYLVPVFWVGFNLLLMPAGALTRRAGGWRVMAIGALVAAAAAVMTVEATSLRILVTMQFVAGGAWACVLMSAFSTALAIGRTGREGTTSGALSSVLALGALVRMAAIAAALRNDAAWQPVLTWLPAIAWIGGGALLLATWRARKGRRPTSSD